MINPAHYITELQLQWAILQDLDRAEAVATIHQVGVSLRRRANSLNCSESLLGNLLHALEASPGDLALARLGKISTWELARRSVVNRKGLALMPPEASASEIAQAAIIGYDTIRDWLAEQSLDNPYDFQVSKEAHRLLADADRVGKLPCGCMPSGMTTDEVIRRCQPAEPISKNAEFVSWFARWLASWSYYAIPDSCIRGQVFQLLIENSSVAH